MTRADRIKGVLLAVAMGVTYAAALFFDLGG